MFGLYLQFFAIIVYTTRCTALHVYRLCIKFTNSVTIPNCTDYPSLLLFSLSLPLSPYFVSLLRTFNSLSINMSFCLPLFNSLLHYSSYLHFSSSVPLSSFSICLLFFSYFSFLFILLSFLFLCLSASIAYFFSRFFSLYLFSPSLSIHLWNSPSPLSAFSHLSPLFHPFPLLPFLSRLLLFHRYWPYEGTIYNLAHRESTAG